eukprot:Gregarina_sp_Poly_1__4499@NODE_2418_length_2157_cov_20_403828_g1538_i0_p4_GENE_NODE_2418_length_2157_cov_20_403828_g1538_i0NODE_2418_length_2157_cov_20_403828_g1538_i0_p4_ORF_typecomplete_len143_score20_73Staphylokinase/PF02821_16/0_04Staphylokinase/PF02821_16/1_1e04_NODE_2418_length_2157_cov_20_403828_g1538_i07601188
MIGTKLKLGLLRIMLGNQNSKIKNQIQRQKRSRIFSEKKKESKSKNYFEEKFLEFLRRKYHGGSCDETHSIKHSYDMRIHISNVPIFLRIMDNASEATDESTDIESFPLERVPEVDEGNVRKKISPVRRDMAAVLNNCDHRI